jgi:hypothetical protein
LHGADFRPGCILLFKRFEENWPFFDLEAWEAITGDATPDLLDKRNARIAAFRRHLDTIQPRDDYRKLLELSVIVVYDFAERRVALIQDFNLSLTKSEKQKQFLLQVVEDHRHKLPNADKSTVTSALWATLIIRWASHPMTPPPPFEALYLQTLCTPVCYNVNLSSLNMMIYTSFVVKQTNQ